MANDLNAMIPEVYSKKLSRVAKQFTKFIENNCNRNWEGEIKAFGDTVRITLPDPANVNVAFAGKDGVCPVNSDVTPTQQTLEINKVATYALRFTDVENVQSQFDVLEGYNAIAMQKLGDGKDKQVMLAAIAEAQRDAALDDLVGTAAAPVTVTKDDIYDKLVDIRMELTQRGVLSADGYYSFKGNEEEPEFLRPVYTVSPKLLGLMLKSTQLTHPTANADGIIKNADVNMMAGFEIQANTVIGGFTSADIDDLAEGAAVGIAATKMGVTYANQFTKVEEIRDTQCFATIVRGLELYGFKVVHPEAIVATYFTIG